MFVLKGESYSDFWIFISKRKGQCSERAVAYVSLPLLVMPLYEWLIILRWSINSKHFLELKAHYQVNMDLQLGQRMSQMNVFHTLSSSSFKIHFHINTTGVRGSFQSSFFQFIIPISF